MSEITPNTPNPVREDAYKQQLAAKLGIDPKYIPGSPIWHSEEEIAAIAEMFANMSGGGSSGGGVLVVNQTWDENWTTATLDKTWQEIHDADVAIVRDASDGSAVSWFPVVSAHEVIGSKPYEVDTWDFGNNQANMYYASSASGYPSYTA